MKIIARRPGGDITVEVSKVFGGKTGTDLVALARHWYYALLIFMWLQFADNLAHFVAWLGRVA